ncbi:DUF4381 domain-containing protein [Microbulbifer sp. VTAC004]|uniref:DUF4381 domain-containing protein n=1 Tax=Microbulbifer TaxID=48073 RepID=UPI0003608443|nr:DUF4381 domain-containing protein [Microbulbifer variabilis]
MLRKQQQMQSPSPEAQELLAQLYDIQEPTPISWWPPAPGWWILAAILLLSVLGITLLVSYQRKKAARNRYRIEAIKLLEAVDNTQATATAEINEILKRVAVTTFGRSHCGNLTGDQWLSFLEKSAAHKCPPDARQALLEQLYRGVSDPRNNQALREYAITWVKIHGLQSHQPSALVHKEAAGV